VRNVAITAIIAAATLAIPALALADPYEPNDSAMQATPLHAGLNYYGSIDTIVDEDWYVFYSPGTQQVVVNMTNALHGPWDGSQDIEVIGPNGYTVRPSGGSSSATAVWATMPFTGYYAVSAGRYYVRVWAGSSDPSKDLGLYDLRLVPSDRFVDQGYVDAIGRLAPAQQAVKDAQTAVNTDAGAITKDKAMMRRYVHQRPVWRIWHRRLLTAQHKLSMDKPALKSAQATLAGIQTAINADSAPF